MDDKIKEEIKPLKLFLKTLHLNAETFRINGYHDSDKNKPPREIIGALEKIILQVASWNKDGYGIFNPIQEIPVNEPRQAKYVTKINTFVLDFDGGDYKKALKDFEKAGIPANMTVQTSLGKFHVYILVDECPLESYTPMQKFLARKWGGDPAVCDLPRVMRLPSPFHRKDPKNPFKVKFVGDVNPVRYPFDKIVKAVGFDADSKEKTNSNLTQDKLNQEKAMDFFAEKNAPIGKTIPEIKEMLDQLDPDMKRPDWLKVLMAVHLETQASPEGLELVVEWSQGGKEKYVEGDPERVWDSLKLNPAGKAVGMASVIDMINKGENTLPAGKKSSDPKKSKSRRSKVIALDYAKTRNHGMRVQWLIKRTLPLDSIGLLFGDPGTYKSFIALDMAIHCALSRDWHNLKMKNPGSVIYIAGEGQAGIRDRIQAWELKNDIKIPEGKLFITTGAVNLYEKEEAEEVTQMIDKIVEISEKPALVILDTLARNFGPGDENSTGDMGVFIDHLDEYIRRPYGCATLIVHHSGHGDKSRARGAMALTAAVDFAYRAEKFKKAKTLRRLICTKMKDAEEPIPMIFEGEKVQLGVDEDMEELSSLVMQSATEREADKPLPQQATKLLSLAQDLADQEGNIDRKHLKDEALRKKVSTSEGQYMKDLRKLREFGLILYYRGKKDPIKLIPATNFENNYGVI